jgi:hypothetical protein
MNNTLEPLRTSIIKIPTPYELRHELECLIFNELLGPAGGLEEEVAEDRVSDRYLVGMLAPQHRKFDQSSMTDDLPSVGSTSTEEGKVDTGIPPLTRTMFPSSFGMSFCVSTDAKAISITAKWGHYFRQHSSITTNAEGNPKMVWKRRQIEAQSLPVKLVEGSIPKWTVHPEFPDVFVQGLVRKQVNEWIVSIFLVNGQTEPDKSADTAWLFQPELSVESSDSSHKEIFLRRQRLRINSDSTICNEEESMAMLYRKHVEFAIGHGVSVHAEVSESCTDKAVRISTATVPSYEVPRTTPPRAEEIPELSGLVLDMKTLAEIQPNQLRESLKPLTFAYEQWISNQKERLSDSSALLDEHKNAANSALDNCAKALARIHEGLELLSVDPLAAEAFQFMNRAMWQQRIHTLVGEKTRRGEKVELGQLDIPFNRTWFPFQLAFILINLPGLTKLDHPDRTNQTDAHADLLWFPTGGGKTEAYLGLTAYTLGIRRLQGLINGRSGEHGVAVLMRYTLRLLTIQQFQRATALICACEAIRREAVDRGDFRFGREPFRIGLWVGQKTTPNSTEQSEEAIRQSRGLGYFGSTGSPHQLNNCPWCGSKIDPGQNIKVEKPSNGCGRTLVFCGDVRGQCLFTERRSPGEGIPAIVVDEEIYRRLPSLLIATVDKFAQMPWNGAIQTLFGQVNGYCERHGFRTPEIEDSPSHQKKGNLPSAKTIPFNPLRPPDLIIQDELHLISGPLGTLVGLYETAIDKLSSWEVNGKVVHPKIVASTATIKQAREQVHSLFTRRVQIFPPQGLDDDDNFFSRQRKPGEGAPGRKYLGICAYGRRLKQALIRVYVAQLSAAQTLYDKYGVHADPWMTLVGYFNSLNELGGMRRVVEDDIRSRLAKMDRRGLAKRQRLTLEELTSRKSSTDIPNVLDRLETAFDPTLKEEIERLKRAGKKVDKHEPLDVLLATNMLSVGVDVKRLGCMVVAGQPKTTAEYIQATSRVGRNIAAPGLVITVFNWARPRDLSHYESFEQYHKTFYQHVEALSVTPFASGAIERGLAGLMVSMIRLASLDYNENAKAGHLQRNSPLIRDVIETIANRAWAVSGEAEVKDYVKQELAHKLDLWLDQAHDTTGGRMLGYRPSREGMGVMLGLLKDPYSGQWDEFTCLKSLRNVEPTVNLILDSRPLDDDTSRVPIPMADVQNMEDEE